MVGPGGTFGELALLGAPARRSATVVALERTETWSIHRDDFDALRAAHPAINELLLESFAGPVRGCPSSSWRLCTCQPTSGWCGRLALTPAYGRAEIPVTQDGLATLAGASRAAVKRVLGELAAAGVIAVARGRVAVSDRDRLARAAQ